MSIRAVLAALVLLPTLAHASLVIDATVACSGALDVRSFDDATPDQLGCSGDLSLTHGRLTSNHSLLIDATGDLWLSDIVVSASTLTLTAGASVTIERDVALGSSEIALPVDDAVLHGGAVVLATDARFVSGPLTLAVPEPDTGLLAGCGLGLALAATRIRQRQRG
jgi:hypothetical protein